MPRISQRSSAGLVTLLAKPNTGPHPIRLTVATMPMRLDADLEDQTAAEGATAAAPECLSCRRDVEGAWTFGFKSNDAKGTFSGKAEAVKCFLCALRHRPMLVKSLAAALVVGTALTLLNQGDAIFAGELSGALFWKIPLTYCVPFLVATFGALSNSKR